MKRQAVVQDGCVACGVCAKACPKDAVSVWKGVEARVNPEACVGCGTCAAECPANAVRLVDAQTGEPLENTAKPLGKRGSTVAQRFKKTHRHWYDYLFVVTPVYLALGFFNILFAWIGLLFFCLPLIISAVGAGKLYCNRFCDRGQFLDLLGTTLGLSRNVATPRWMSSKAFRYGFLVFFLAMFVNMLFVTWLVAVGTQELGQAVQLLWTFRLPWDWAYPVAVAPGVAQFAFGFYSLMLTSNLIGLVVMALFKPRSWCAFCPMGTMTQLVSRLRARGKQGPCQGCGR